MEGGWPDRIVVVGGSDGRMARRDVCSRTWQPRKSPGNYGHGHRVSKIGVSSGWGRAHSRLPPMLRRFGLSEEEFFATTGPRSIRLPPPRLASARPSLRRPYRRPAPCRARRAARRYAVAAGKPCRRRTSSST
jgi:hypothetical protein